MPNQPIAHRAREIEEWIEAKMVDTNGVVYSFVDRVTGKPITNDVVEPIDPIHLRKGTRAGWWAYENCTMVTAAYMQGLVYRYETDGDISAIARARRCFKALSYIYELGKQLEEGFMPKIYDNQFTEDTSSDQVLFAILALDHFHHHANETEKQEISHMIACIVNFWVKREYKYDYGMIKDMQWPLARFTAKTLMAYKHSGDQLFKNEYERLLALGVNEYPGEEQVRLKLAGKFEPSDLEKEEGGWLLTYPTACAQMDLSELDYLLRTDPNNKWAARWKRSCIQMWNEGSMMIAENGRAYTTLIMDFETHELRPLSRSRFLDKNKKRTRVDNFGEPDVDGFSYYPYMLFMHSCKSAYTAPLFARAGIQASQHFPREITIRPLARRILKSLGLFDMTYLDQPELLAPEFKYMTNLISGDSVTHWLWGYWQGRTLGVFNENE